VDTLSPVLTTLQLDHLAHRTLRDLRGLSAAQRDALIERILHSDPELRPVLPELLALYRTRRPGIRLGPLSRDSVM